MIRLVTLDRVKQWLGVIHDADDEKLDFAIQGASQAVINYLGLEEADFDAAAVPEVEQIATAILVRKLYDGMDPAELQYGRLPVEVTSMLYIRRSQMGIA